VTDRGWSDPESDPVGDIRDMSDAYKDQRDQWLERKARWQTGLDDVEAILHEARRDFAILKMEIHSTAGSDEKAREFLSYMLDSASRFHSELQLYRMEVTGEE